MNLMKLILPNGLNPNHSKAVRETSGDGSNYKCRCNGGTGKPAVGAACKSTENGTIVVQPAKVFRENGKVPVLNGNFKMVRRGFSLG